MSAGKQVMEKAATACGHRWALIALKMERAVVITV